MPRNLDERIRKILQQGIAIPASPLALTSQRKFDERRQKTLCRYYIASGSGGLAVGVHTTQFRIHDPKVGLFEPVLSLTIEEMKKADMARDETLIRIAGVYGNTSQAISEAGLAEDLGYHAVLLSLASLKHDTEDELIDHCIRVSRRIPVVGFYLQPSVGGRVLSYSFWRKFAEIENVVAIKIAPFNRYRTLDVVRAISESGRDDIALYTGNDDNIIMDLITPYRFLIDRKVVVRRIVGGLLGHWSVWTKKAVEIFKKCRALAIEGKPVSPEILRLSIEVTDCNSAFFDIANSFKGCIPGLHEVLRRQGLLEGLWCLNPDEVLGAGQLEEIDRVYSMYPNLNDDEFVAEHLDEWLR